MSRWKPKRPLSPRRGKVGRSAGQRSTPDRTVYHTYKVAGGWTFYITDTIPRTDHRWLLDAMDEAAAEPVSQQISIPDSPWGELVLCSYPHSKTAYVETRRQFEAMLRYKGPN